MNKYFGCILILILSSACRLEEQTFTGPMHIVVTTGIIEDGVERIVGDSAEVSVLMGPGTDPHLYAPTPGDIELLDEADVIVSNGLHLEGKMAEMLQKYSQEKPVIEVAQGIDEKLYRKSADYADAYDPHIWFNPEVWKKGLAHVKKELVLLDSSKANYFSENYEKYAKEIEDMNAWVKTKLNTLDQGNKVLITSHDAFGYFGDYYAVEVKGIQGISTLSEVGLRDIAEMVDYVIERKVKSIFVETSTSQKTAQSIVDGAKDKGFELALEGPLYSDALGEPDSDAGTYIGMFKANVEMIVNGLNKE